MQSKKLLPLFLAFLMIESLVSATEKNIAWKNNSLQEQTSKNKLDTLQAFLQSAKQNHLVLQFTQPVNEQKRAQLRSQGITLLNYLGNHAYFALISKINFQLEEFSADQNLLRVDAIQAEHRTHPAILNNEIPGYAIVDNTNVNNPRVAIYVMFQPDVDLATQGLASITDLGGDVIDVLESINALVAQMPLSAVLNLGTDDHVQWIELPLPQMSGIMLNDSNRSITQTNVVQGAPFNLNGSGVNVLVYDAGTALATHNDFGGRLTVRDSSGTNFHSTHVAGTIGGSGVASGGTFKGMAPAVTMQAYGFEYNGQSIFLYTNPGDIESDYDEAINTFGVDLSSNSIGTNTETNGFPCNIQGDYGITSALLDAIVHGSLGSPFRIVWANGNERQGSRCDLEGFGDYYSTAPPAGAKNMLSIGALNSNDDSMTSFSSWGPTDDGRLKPDISGPGCQSNGDFGVTSTGDGSPTQYITLCGTSMATPTVAGLTALLLQDYRAQFGGADPLNSTIKALFAHNAAEGGNPGPDYQFGYGSARIQNTIVQMRTGNFTEQTINGQGESYRFTVNVGAGNPELKLTLAWDDAPGTPNVLPALVNDLDLRVLDPLGAQKFPWTLDPSNPGANAVKTQADHANIMEQVQVSSPMTGTWTVEVFGFDVPQGPQTFSLVSSHVLNMQSFLQLGYISVLPAQIAPGSSTTVTAQIVGVNETVVVNSPTLHFRYAGSSFLSTPLPSVGGDLYQAQLPPPVCGANVEFYISAQGSVSGLNLNPQSAPGTALQASVANSTAIFSDNFETNMGWTVTNISLTDGPWTRGVPAGAGDRGDPLTDYDGSGQCFLTDNVAGNSDVDGGPTQLLSPSIDLSGLNGTLNLSYARWFANDDFDIDRMLIEISNNNGASWTTVENLGNTNGWGVHSVDVASLVAPTNQMRLRFSATDNPNDSVTEAAVDAVKFELLNCDTVLSDCNDNGIVDSDDIASGRSIDANSNGLPDECEEPKFHSKKPKKPVIGGP